MTCPLTSIGVTIASTPFGDSPIEFVQCDFGEIEFPFDLMHDGVNRSSPGTIRVRRRGVLGSASQRLVLQRPTCSADCAARAIEFTGFACLQGLACGERFGWRAAAPVRRRFDSPGLRDCKSRPERPANAMTLTRAVRGRGMRLRFGAMTSPWKYAGQGPGKRSLNNEYGILGCFPTFPPQSLATLNSRKS